MRELKPVDLRLQVFLCPYTTPPMAGIYVHIPFCKTRCIYCDFFSTTLLGMREKYVDAVCMEVKQQEDYLGGETVETVYLGGGTPSQLSVGQIGLILNAIQQTFKTSGSPEITVELNPEDVTPEYARGLNRLAVNRVSLGIQSFDDNILRFIHRRHNSAKAIEAVSTLQDMGFDNISIDLMFGFPQQTLDGWIKDINTALSLGVQHLSAYSLMYEEGTRLYSMLQGKEIQEIDDGLSLEMYRALTSLIKEHGYTHYEISNFALPGHESRHNSNYWNSTPYLGVGSGAHSFNGTSRQWNVSDIHQYIQGINGGKAVREAELLTTDQRFNETVMTRLRTAKGLDLNCVSHQFGTAYVNHLEKAATPYYISGELEKDGQTVRLTEQGIYISNDIMSSLFI